MFITVAICTWNRAALLDPTLTRFRSLTVPTGLDWELIVVDNNCTDATPEVLARHSPHLPLKVVREAKQGHSHARNRAVDEARGEWLLWTDDDVLVHPDWLTQHAAATQQFPQAQFFGGPVRPWYESAPPAWVVRSLPLLGYCWALIDLGPEVRPMAPHEYGYGANLMFRTATLRENPFDPNYGRVKNQLSSGDETRVIDQIRAASGTGVWVGSAAVDHFLPASRMTPAYVSEITYWSGYQGIAPFRDDPAPRWHGAPRWLWKRYLLAAAQAKILAPFRSQKWVEALHTAAKTRGLIARFQADHD